MWNNFDSSTNEGGFMDTTISEGAGGDDKGNLKRGQNCVPVMIAHVRKHGEELNIWGNPVKIITLVVIVNKIESTSTKISFEFQDETGTLKGLKWLEGDNVEYDCPVKPRSYCRVHGLIRDQAGEPYVLVIHIQPMQHLNELLVHLAEVTLITLQGESSQNTPVQNSVAIDNGNSGLNPHQQMVLDIIQNGDPEYGAERNAIKKQVPPIVAPKVDEILDFLSSEGHIYTTKTDDFFKAI
ncbi:replication protein A 32 kDa subunit-like [Phymastichus coffea]|uniref:replication protein A 32 kDa subunit-like n=1 Tax=Phymastichus coffea TaxID=108790 RepID=UPI00273B0BDB|nr:replication protein A 32 kDa subunit-like [Phymastichus coffea]